MEMSRLLTGIYNLCKWITHFAYLNLLWIIFTLIGGVILGIIPSTVAMFAIARKTAMGEEDISVIKTFWSTFRTEFIRANGLGLKITLIGFFWYFDLYFFRQFEGAFYTIMNYLMILIGMVYFMTLLYIFPVFVHYDLKVYQYVTHALKIGFLRPTTLIFMLIGSLSTYYFFSYFTGLIPFFGISFFVYFNMWVAYKSFENFEVVRSKEKKFICAD
ncbi:YesL family protein [Peribacillus sp. ACCC06369]|uniref:YesL family protein n=1 Tax=Peribacillus sp. ACCC06369 TaxID=3055860 RepID=UPI00259FF60E|nr:YesL family protein [Peribacillus sp. ACCC06369]MDM5359380.1 YesL family protein [Peribacillus sp. ACCC06369]